MIDDDALNNIEKLHKLKADGIITQEEFDKAKADLLSGTKRPAAPARAVAKIDPTILPADDDYIAWVLLPLRRYADFNGRSTRKEFWMYQLLYVALFLGCVIIGIGIGATAAAVLFLLAALGLFVPLIAVQVRRFHDQDRSGALALLNFIPYVGTLIVFAMMLIDGTWGANQYGPDPKGRA